MNKKKLFYIAIIFALSIVQLRAQEIKLTKEQMLQDFDQIFYFISDFSVHKDLNEVRFDINYDNQFKKLRNEIKNETSICEFRDIFERAISLVQDQHCSSMPYSYYEKYGKFQRKYNFDNDHNYKSIKFFEEFCEPLEKILELPLVFYKGEYIVYADFEYKNIKVSKGSVITNYNGLTVSNFIQENFDKVWPVKCDDRNKIIYNERFYQYGDTNFKLGLKGANQDLIFSLSDSITYAKKPIRKISYYSQGKEQIMHFKESNTLYIGMPFMDAEKGELIVKQMKQLHKENGDFSKVIIDIRGNPGGNDMCWQNVVSNLIYEPLNFDVDLKFKHNKNVLDYYNEGKITPNEKIELLDNSDYWTESKSTFVLDPSNTSIKHKGKIYVLQDKYIYSSAANLSTLCSVSEQLVSVGQTTDLVGGLQTEPLFFKLDHSELIFRIEPMLDFSGVKSIDDFAHNHVEVKIEASDTDYFLRTTYEGDIYSQDFLLKNDNLIKHVLNDN